MFSFNVKLSLLRILLNRIHTSSIKLSTCEQQTTADIECLVHSPTYRKTDHSTHTFSQILTVWYMPSPLEMKIFRRLENQFILNIKLTQTLAGVNCNFTFQISKCISKVEVFKEQVKLQGQGHSVKTTGTHGKVLSQGILM